MMKPFRTCFSLLLCVSSLTLASSAFGQSAFYQAATKTYEQKCEIARLAYVRAIRAAAQEYLAATQREQQSGSSVDTASKLKELEQLMAADDPRVAPFGRSISTPLSIKIVEALVTGTGKWQHAGKWNYEFERNGTFKLEFPVGAGGKYRVEGNKVLIEWNALFGNPSDSLTYNESAGMFVHSNGKPFLPLKQ